MRANERTFCMSRAGNRGIPEGSRFVSTAQHSSLPVRGRWVKAAGHSARKHQVKGLRARHQRHGEVAMSVAGHDDHTPLEKTYPRP